MSNLDQFASIFRSAVKTPYTHQEIKIKKILLVTDLSESAAKEYQVKINHFLNVLNQDNDPVHWQILSEKDYSTINELIEILEQSKVDLICSYRNLYSSGWEYQYSLGSQMDILLQATKIPVLILPHPKAGRAAFHSLQTTQNVMVITDHLGEHHDLIQYASAFTDDNGKLTLTHIEDQRVFDHYINAIGKIDSIDTEHAKKRLAEQLLKEPTDYIESCKTILSGARSSLKIEALVTFGDSLAEYKKHIEQYQLDLLVMNAKDKEQMAMHGMAYPLAIELRQIPLLML